MSNLQASTLEQLLSPYIKLPFGQHYTIPIIELEPVKQEDTHVSSTTMRLLMQDMASQRAVEKDPNFFVTDRDVKKTKIKDLQDNPRAIKLLGMIEEFIEADDFDTTVKPMMWHKLVKDKKPHLDKT